MSENAPVVAFRRLRPEDLPFVVDQHLLHFPDGFFARLGRGYLTEYYLSYCTDHSSCVVVATDGAMLIGYLAGTSDPAGHRRHVINTHGRELTKRAVLALIRNPPLAVNFARTRGRRYLKKLLSRRGPAPAASEPSRRAAVLHHVVVVREFQGRGVGAALIEVFEDDARHAGCHELALVTQTGGPAADYYRQSGWTAVDGHRTPDGTPLTTFTKPVTSREPGSEHARNVAE